MTIHADPEPTVWTSVSPTSDPFASPVDVFPYADGRAFRQALTDRIKRVAADGGRGFNEIKRQFVYDRFLSRLFIRDSGEWVLKGGATLLARAPATARHSRDVDVFYAGRSDDAIAAVRAAAEVDLGDFFRFAVEVDGALTGRHQGVRAKVIAYLGSRYDAFGLDLVVSASMTAPPDRIPNPEIVEVPGLMRAAYTVYPLVDHVADKVAAMLEQYGERRRPSSRVRDLLDLLIIATAETVDAQRLTTAVHAELANRGITAPPALQLPDPSWEKRWATVAGQSPSETPATANEALTLVRRMIDPVLAKSATGSWDPVAIAWN